MKILPVIALVILTSCRPNMAEPTFVLRHTCTTDCHHDFDRVCDRCDAPARVYDYYNDHELCWDCCPNAELVMDYCRRSSDPTKPLPVLEGPAE